MHRAETVRLGLEDVSAPRSEAGKRDAWTRCRCSSSSERNVGRASCLPVLFAPKSLSDLEGTCFPCFLPCRPPGIARMA